MTQRRAPRTAIDALALAAAALLFALSLFGRLAHPLLWSDEADTAVFAERVLEFGYPVVHGEKNVSYQFGTNIALGVKESLDAYIGTTWAQFYFAAPAVAWAARGDDPHARTWRLRLPFAAAGALALVAALWAAWPAFAQIGGSRRLRTAAAAIALAALSVSLVLHLREVRYHALLALEIALLAGVALRGEVFRSLAPARVALAEAALLFAIFHTFFSAYFALATLLGARALWLRAHDREVWSAPAAAVTLSALAVLPCALFFETFEISAAFARELGLSPDRVIANLVFAARHLAHHDWLLPALAARAAAARWATADARTHSASFLLGASLGYALLACANPLLYERYFTPLTLPLLLAFLLDASALSARRGVQRSLAAVALACVALRAPEVAGRVREIWTPVRGPLDFAIEAIRARHADPARLVIATNYEEQVLMVYLRSHVIIGLTGNNLLRDRELDPDVVIPRRRWPSQLPEILRFLARGRYALTRLPVEDRWFNQYPGLSPSALVPETHRFETPLTSDPSRQLELYERIGADSPAASAPVRDRAAEAAP
jgi:hypothetical protein